MNGYHKTKSNQKTLLVCLNRWAWGGRQKNGSGGKDSEHGLKQELSGFGGARLEPQEVRLLIGKESRAEGSVKFRKLLWFLERYVQR